MTNDLISREALLAKAYCTGGNYNVVIDIDIKNAPSVDAVEVVRCGECKSCFRDEYGTLECHRHITGGENYLEVIETDHCSWGKHRESEVSE